MTRLLAALVVLAPACNTPATRCERARDAIVKAQRSTSEGLHPKLDADERAALVAELEASIAQIESQFVEACLALPEAGQACIVRFDELQAAAIEVHHARRRCPAGADGQGDSACLAAADAKRNGVWGDCELALQPLEEKVLKR